MARPSDNIPTQSLPSGQKWLKRGELFTPEPDTIWQLESGFLRTITWDDEGELTTLGIWGPGEQISTAFTSFEPYQAECLTSVTIGYLSDIADCPCELLLNRAQRTEELLYLLHIRSTQTRLFQALAWLAQRFGEPTDMGMLLPFHITQQVLADLIGSTRITVSRLLNYWKNEKKILLVQRRILLPVSFDSCSSQSLTQ